MCEHEAAAICKELEGDVADGRAMPVTANALLLKELNFPKLLQLHLASYHGCSWSGQYVKSSGMPEANVLMMLTTKAMKAMMLVENRNGQHMSLIEAKRAEM